MWSKEPRGQALACNSEPQTARGGITPFEKLTQLLQN